ncbi:hypothetical protein IW261DRAFT_1610937 [Armillaria novae-zelandiae]|uniref:Uncharacterized protein n=1 Tax=Armillaria novae-zelandiae TaxID=153914 RepID=A0AA39U3V9_9AGAR|nr:hypothetical protein IW261DRAFT_1610937 [Armillaria novae-zelandiae]
MSVTMEHNEEHTGASSGADQSRGQAPPVKPETEAERLPEDIPPLQDLSESFEETDYDDVKIGLGTVMQPTSIPLHRYPRSTKSDLMDRKDAAITILKHGTKLGNHLAKEPYLSHKDYYGVFTRDMAILEKLLKDFTSVTTEHTDDRLDEKTYSEFQKMPAEIEGTKLAHRHIRVLLQLVYTFGPRIELDEDWQKEKERHERESSMEESMPNAPATDTSFNIGNFRYAATGEPEPRNRSASVMRNASQYSRKGSELLGLHSNSNLSAIHRFGQQEPDNLRSSSLQQTLNDEQGHDGQSARDAGRHTRPGFDPPEPSDEGDDGDNKDIDLASRPIPLLGGDLSRELTPAHQIYTSTQN